MKRNVLILVAVFALLIAATLFIWSRQNKQSATRQITANTPSVPASQQATPGSPSPPSNAPEGALPAEIAAKLPEAEKRNIEKILQAFKAPISFYGKVVDEKGQPIAGVKVHYSAADQYFGDSSKYERVSDSNGSFSIGGINGAGLFVSVAKDGYYGTDESGAGFGYGVPSGRQPPSKENPAIFALRKKGTAEPLVYVSSRSYKVPRDGMPLEIDLKTGHQVSAGVGDIKIERWANDQDKDANGRFDWKCRISVPGGGLLEKTDQFDFEAPENDYQDSVEVNMPKTLGLNWKWSIDTQYFLKLRDGVFARVAVTMYAGHNNFLVLESYLNLRLGSRNLEYDPTKQASAR